jgi:hypothetical protein
MIIPIDIFKKVIPILQKRIYTIREFFSAQALLVTLKRAKADATPPEGGAGFWASKSRPAAASPGRLSIAQAEFSTTFSFEESPTCPVCLPLFPAQHCSL